MTEKEPIWKGAWRPASAAIYLTICLADFVIMPIIFAEKSSPAEVIEQVMKLDDTSVQIAALSSFANHQAWKPLTTEGNAIFHLSFGAILGFAAHGRSREKIARAENY